MASVFHWKTARPLFWWVSRPGRISAKGSPSETRLFLLVQGKDGASRAHRVPGATHPKVEGESKHKNLRSHPIDLVSLNGNLPEQKSDAKNVKVKMMIFHRTCFKTKIHGSLSSAITGWDWWLREKNFCEVGDLCLAVQGGQSDGVCAGHSDLFGCACPTLNRCVALFSNAHHLRAHVSRMRKKALLAGTTVPGKFQGQKGKITKIWIKLHKGFFNFTIVPTRKRRLIFFMDMALRRYITPSQTFYQFNIRAGIHHNKHTYTESSTK